VCEDWERDTDVEANPEPATEGGTRETMTTKEQLAEAVGGMVRPAQVGKRMKAGREIPGENKT